MQEVIALHESALLDWNFIYILVDGFRRKASHQKTTLIVPTDISTSVKAIWIVNVLFLEN